MVDYSFNLSEVWGGIRAAWLADDEIRLKLGQPDGIFRAWPNTAVTYPILTINASTSSKGTRNPGIWLANAQINAYGPDPRKLEELFWRFEFAWSIPVRRTTPLDFDHFRVSRMAFGPRREIGWLRLQDTNQNIVHHTFECDLRFALRSLYAPTP